MLPVISLYYSVFYSCRALLGASHSIGLFYFDEHFNNKNDKPKLKLHSWEIQEGTCPSKINKTTHESVLEIYKSKGQRNAHNLLLSQEIDQQDPLSWLKTIREQVNYKQVGFTEPSTLECFQRLSSYKMRRLISEYIEDIEKSRYLFTFDPEHSAISYPLLFIVETIKAIKGKSSLNGLDTQVFSPEQCDFLKQKIVDESGHKFDKLQEVFLSS